ncbi:non-ribosomal peptide synthetase [Auritidibacter ignavus]|uniref:non-ribosomal peptide synthetase n=1 Tax=Auritidibacter ignavus TaxID=678932 RepID=UPI0024475352|nr:non-ribosomal peptide synthetase [Auritidibacter ignavus]WGH85644.1 amino acid adenylation domain-containing protein [Auritidibacter ignavus]
MNPISEVLPTTSLQDGILFHSTFDVTTNPDAYNTQLKFGLRGEIDERALEIALQHLVDRHQTLRARFPSGPDGDTLQVILKQGSVHFQAQVADLDESAELITRQRLVPFDLEQGPLIRAGLFSLPSGDQHVLSLVIHHIVIDGWSIPILLRDLFSAYAHGPESFTTPSVPLRNFYEWYSCLDKDVARERWIQALEDVEQPCLVAPDAGADKSSLHQLTTAELPEELTASIRGTAQKLGVTTNIILETTWAMVLSHITGEPTVVFGEPVSGREGDFEGVHDLVGMLLNTVPVSLTVRGDVTLAELIRERLDRHISTLDHQHLPLTEIAHAIGQKTLFDSLFVFENAPIGSIGDNGPDDVEIVDFEVNDHTAYPLAIKIVPDNALTINVDYRSDVFSATEVAAWMSAWQRALVAVVDDPHQFVGNVDLAGDELRDQLESFNQTGTVAVPAVLPDLFAQQVALHSQRLAVSGADDGLTYEQLDRESNRVARYLIDLGVGPESIVAILLPRGVDALVSILGVIKAGGAYLPVDPEYPLERIDYILNDACPSFVVASSSRGSGRSGEILIEDRPWQAVSDRVVEQQDRVRALGVDDPAYLIYTSGSTGKPKGVLVTHRGLADLAGQQQRSLEVTPNSRVLQFASLSFDAAVYEMVMAWCSGACLISVGSADLVPGTTLAETVKREGVTHAVLTPSVLKVCNPDDFSGITHLVVAAEACSAELVQEWAPGRLMVNAYGPTEDTVNSTITGALVPGEDAPSIGRPFPGTSIYVLDGNLNPCPVGVTGELFIAGIGLARGYFRRPGLTAERFIADPFAGGGARMYRSGDLARWNEHGEVVFEGRNDDQVKIRGFRVETGEVEAALLRVPGVAQATVMVREDMPGHRQLVGYVVAGSDDVEPALVREQLRQWLPDYMVPAAVVELEKIPLTHNGKTDFRQLPRPELDDARLIVEPVSETERVLVQLYSEVLGLDSVSTDESFFALGGDSIMAIQLVNRIRARGLSVKPADVFSSPTVRDLSSRICEVDAEGANSPVELGSTTTNETSEANSKPVASSGDESNLLPLTGLQTGIHSLSLIERDSSPGVYNVGLAIGLSGKLDHLRLGEAFRSVVGRHDSLRATFVANEVGVVSQRVAPHGELGGGFSIEFESVLSDREAWHAAEALRLVPFDLEQGPLIRAGLFSLPSGDQHVLSLVIHHIVIDGWSIPILLRDLFSAYAHGPESFTTPSVPLRNFYEWYSCLDKDVARERWIQALEDVEQPCLVAPDAGADKSSLHQLTTAELPEELTASIRGTAQKLGVTTNIILETTWAMVLSHITGEPTVVFGEPVSGREGDFEGVHDLVGMLLNTVPVSLTVRGDVTLAELIRERLDRHISTLDHQHLPLTEIAHAIGQKTLFDSLFVFENAPRLEESYPSIPGLTVGEIKSFDSTSYPLTVMVVPDGGLSIVFDYRSDVFSATEVAAWMSAWQRALVAVVDDPHQFVGNVDLAGDELRDQLESFNQTGTVAVPAVLPDLFAQQVALHSQRLAVSGADDGLTYEQLDRESNRVARYLIDLGVGPESIVAILLPRGVDALVSILGVIKAGGAYLPVDPEYPLERIDYILNDACPSFVVASSSRGSGRSGEILIEDRPWQAVSDRVVEQQDRVRALGVDDPAYLIYTSGSTGKPKGVLVTHRGLADFVTTESAAFGVGPGQRFMHMASTSFDISVEEIFVTLCSGAELSIVEGSKSSVDADLVTTIRKVKPSHMSLTPALLATVDPDEVPEGLVVVVGGEACTSSLVEDWSKNHSLFNTYGPTESSVVSTLTGALVPGEDAPSIGRPFPGTSIYVLDGNLNPCPVGVTGELFIAGIGLARGYFRRPGLTAERFIADPFAGGGARMYRSGDLARWNEHGEVVFEGRNDDQVKIRGFRVETGEVEAALLRVPGVAQATVMVREDMPGHRQLVGYVVAGSDDVEPALVREQLRQWLPDYMVPAAVVELEKIPLTHNGKTDFRQLPRPELDDARLIVEPVSETERVLVQLYSEVLGLDSVSTDESFFALGGDSIMAIQLVNRIRAELKLDVTARLVYNCPSISALASALTAGLSDIDEPHVLTLREGTGAPVVAIHPGAGTGHVYSRLLPVIPQGRPFYAVQAPEYFGDVSDSSIELLARRHMEGLSGVVQDWKRTTLVGWSSGGTVAAEIVRQLEERGEAVSSLVVIDSVDPAVAGANQAQVTESDIVTLLARHAEISLNDLSPSVISGVDSFYAWAEHSGATNVLPTKTDALRMGRCLDRMGALLNGHVDPSHISADVLVIVASTGATSALDTDAHWRHRANGEVKSVSVPTTHDELLTEAGIRSFEGSLRVWLDSH